MSLTLLALIYPSTNTIAASCSLLLKQVLHLVIKSYD